MLLGVYPDKAGLCRRLYSMNANLGGVTNAAVQAPAGCVLLVDESQSLNNGNFLPPTTDSAAGSANYNDVPTTRHTEGGVFAFDDGHAKWFRPERLRTANFDPAANP